MACRPPRRPRTRTMRRWRTQRLARATGRRRRLWRRPCRVFWMRRHGAMPCRTVQTSPWQRRWRRRCAPSAPTRRCAPWTATAAATTTTGSVRPTRRRMPPCCLPLLHAFSRGYVASSFARLLPLCAATRSSVAHATCGGLPLCSSPTMALVARSIPLPCNQPLIVALRSVILLHSEHVRTILLHSVWTLCGLASRRPLFGCSGTPWGRRCSATRPSPQSAALATGMILACFQRAVAGSNHHAPEDAIASSGFPCAAACGSCRPNVELRCRLCLAAAVLLAACAGR